MRVRVHVPVCMKELYILGLYFTPNWTCFKRRCISWTNPDAKEFIQVKPELPVLYHKDDVLHYLLNFDLIRLRVFFHTDFLLEILKRMLGQILFSHDIFVFSAQTYDRDKIIKQTILTKLYENWKIASL